MKTIGDRIREIRESLELTGEKFGKRLNVSRAAVSNWESNNRTPDAEMLVKIADLGNVSVDYILGRTKRPTEAIAKQEIDGDIFEFNYDINKFPKGISKDEAKELLKKLQDFQSELMKNL